MPFVKALPMQGRFKGSFYGEQGTGKTLTSMMVAEGFANLRGKRIAAIDTERSMRKWLTQRVPARTAHPEPFDFDVIETRSLSEVITELRKLDPREHGAIVLDSMTHLSEALREAWESKNPGKEIALRDWGPINKPIKDLMKWVVDADFEVLMCGRQKNVFTEEDGKLKNVGVAMKAHSDIPYEPDFCFHMMLVGERGKTTQPAMFVEKDRCGVLQGRTYPNPNFETFRPLLPFLGSSQPTGTDEEERLASDGELLTQGEEKAAKKMEKSAACLANLQALIQGALTPEALSAVYAQMKKDKRYMTEDHVGACRVLYDQRRADIINATMPQEA